MEQKALFFLRHYNDIDHIVPVIHKWCTVDKVPIEIIITGNKEILSDFRIEFLRQYHNLHISFVSEVFPVIEERCLHQKLDTLFKDVENGIIAFDWIMATSINKMVETVIEWSLDREIPTISLPHGDNPQYSRMLFVNEISYDSTDIYWTGGIFDYVVVPNELCARRYRSHMGPDRIKILGSPRFNDEWLGILKSLTPEYVNEKSNGKLKIVFFLFHRAFSGFWEEVINTIRLVAQFQEVYLIVVEQTRGEQKNHPLNYFGLDKCIDSLPNVELARENTPSSSLIHWADLVMDMGTSIVYEAVKLNKPVISMEYLHATHSAIAHFLKDTSMTCRDQLYDTIEHFIRYPNHLLYTEQERKKILEEVIDTGGSSTLNDYVGFLQDCLKDKGILKRDRGNARRALLAKIKNSDLRRDVISRTPEIESMMKRKDKIIAQMDKTIAQMDQKIKRIENTLSWRLTKPLRSEFLRRITALFSPRMRTYK